MLMAVMNSDVKDNQFAHQVSIGVLVLFTITPDAFLQVIDVMVIETAMMDQTSKAVLLVVLQVMSRFVHHA